jgi:hypothetical protein
MEKLDVFMKRMEKLGIEIKLGGNFPWIYIDEINGKEIEEDDYFYGNHGFTIAFYPTRVGQEMKFTDITEIFKLIRKYR